MANKKSKKIPKTRTLSRKRTLTELEDIERLLGEDFESLAQAKRALSREAKSEAKRQKTLGKRQKQQTENELERIEKLLGEQFESLNEARKELDKQTEPSKRAAKKPSKKAIKQAAPVGKLSKKKSYTIRELSPTQKDIVSKFLQDEDVSMRLTKELLNPGEYFGAYIEHTYSGLDGKEHKGVARTYNLYSNLRGMFRRFTYYAARLQKQGVSRKKIDDFIAGIKIVKFKTSRNHAKTKQDWYDAVKSEHEVRERRKATLRARTKKVVVENKKLKEENAALKKALKATKKKAKATKKKK